MAGSPKKRARRLGLIVRAVEEKAEELQPARAPACAPAPAPVSIDMPEEAKRVVAQRLLDAATGQWCPDPAQVAAAKVFVDIIDRVVPVEKPRNAREMLDAVRRALPELERRAALEGGDTQVSEVSEPKGDW